MHGRKALHASAVLTPAGVCAFAGPAGMGKSTLAVHLAAWLHDLGHRVVLADCDTQASSSEWAAEARQRLDALRRLNR